MYDENCSSFLLRESKETKLFSIKYKRQKASFKSWKWGHKIKARKCKKQMARYGSSSCSFQLSCWCNLGPPCLSHSGSSILDKFSRNQIPFQNGKNLHSIFFVMWNVGKYLLTSIQTRASEAKDLSGQKINQLKSCLVSFRQYHLFFLIKADKKKKQITF